MSSPRSKPTLNPYTLPFQEPNPRYGQGTKITNWAKLQIHATDLAIGHA